MDALTVAYFALLYLLIAYLVKWRRSPLYTLPTVGGVFAPGLTFLCGLNMMFRGHAIVAQGYRTYFGKPFKIPMLAGWLVVLTNPEAVKDLRQRPDHEVHLGQGFEKMFPGSHVLGDETLRDPWSLDLVRTRLTRSIGAILPDMMDEIQAALQEYIPVECEEWEQVRLSSTVEDIIIRVVNRAFVGLPLCREKKYLQSTVTFIHSVVKGWFPALVFPAVKALPMSIGKYLHGGPDAASHVTELLRDVLHERRALVEQSGDDVVNIPNDLMQWFVEEGDARNYPDESIVMRLLQINFAALHTTSMSLTHALFDLAAHPEYIQPLREEIEAIVASEGWTKSALMQMWRLDSFLKESHRYNGMSFLTVFRQAMKDVILVDGTVLPKGTLVATPAFSIHHDEKRYPNAHEFDPFRFARMRELDDQDRIKHQLTATSLDWVAFGHGRKACPGRFFAAAQLRSLLAYIVMNYDIRLEGKNRPANFFFSTGMIPSRHGKVLFRKRKPA